MNRGNAKRLAIAAVNRMNPVNPGLYRAVVAACNLLAKNRVFFPGSAEAFDARLAARRKARRDKSQG